MIPYLELMKEISEIEGYNENKLLNLYLYGSRVYGCSSPQSDYDFIAVYDYDSPGDADEFKSSRTMINISVYSPTRFATMLGDHEISAIECISLPEDDILINKCQHPFLLSLPQLRKSISEKTSHSYVKAKKKLTVEKDLDPYRGKKSLFHAFRIAKFGCQIAKYGKIVDFTEANYYWKDIVLNEHNDWQFYHNKYKKEFNELMTEFRKLCPKEV